MHALHRFVLGATLGLSLSFASAQEPVKLKGTVVDTAGQPVVGASVESYLNNLSSRSGADEVGPGARSQTGQDGTFELPGLPDGAVLIARKPGFAPGWKQVHRMIGENRLVLVSPAIMSGVVADENGKPVPNAEVSVVIGASVTEMDGGGRSYNLLMGRIARDLFSARTGPDGRFRIEGFPTNASATLTAKSAGRVLQPEASESLDVQSLPYRPGQEDIRLVVEPAGAVEGEIVCEGTVTQMPVARLILQPDSTGLAQLNSESGMTDANGRFKITSLPEGNYSLRAVFGTNTLPDWVAESVRVSVAAKQTTSGIKINAVRGGLVEVMVRGKDDGKPQAQVSVNAYRQNVQVGATSDRDGLARLRLLEGDYQLQIYRAGADSQTASTTVEKGKTSRVDIELAGARKLRGTVRRPDGQPAADLPVKIVGVYSGSGVAVKTDKDGKFELDWSSQFVANNDMRSCVLVRDVEHNLAAAQDLEEDDAPLELRLEPGLTVAGSAVCDGKPITNATAALVFWTGNTGMHLEGLAVRKGLGQFEIPALPPGRRYGLYVSAPGYGRKYVNTVESDADSKRVEIDPVELSPANMKLAGQVVDDNDKPASGVSVSMQGDGQPNANTRTDREGRFQFEHVCAGMVRLYASARNLSGSFSAEAGDTNVVLKLGERDISSSSVTTRKLQGVITDPNGQPVAGAQVAVFPMSNRQSAKTGSNGVFQLSYSIQPWQLQSGGDPLLVVRHPDRNLAGAEPIADDATNVNMQLKTTATLKGQVADAGGRPIAGAQVGVWLRACNTYSDLDPQPGKTDAAGKFEVKCLPVDQSYIVYASAQGYGRSQQNHEQGGEPGPVELAAITLKAADKSLAGQVVDENEKPIAGASINYSGDDQPQGNTTTDRNGRFKFKVCEGQVRLYANSPNGGYANTMVDAGDTNVILQLTRNTSSARIMPKRLGLKGRPLPDLAPFGLTADAAPKDKPALICLLDAEQRPSRHIARLLSQRSEDLKQRGVAVVMVQATVVPDESLQTWTNASPLPYPLGRMTGKTSTNKWATDVDSMPWFILRGADGKVADEGFGLDELDARLGGLKN